MCGQVHNVHTLLTGLEVECCGYFSQDEDSECMNTLAHAATNAETSLSPRPETKTSMDHFQYCTHYSGLRVACQ